VVGAWGDHPPSGVVRGGAAGHTAARSGGVRVRFPWPAVAHVHFGWATSRRSGLNLLNRKNDQSGSNAPLMSAADHDVEGRHFCAAWQLHRLVQHMRPAGDLKRFPLFPVQATTFVPALPGAPSVYNVPRT
jgi:hypothetical protein